MAEEAIAPVAPQAPSEAQPTTPEPQAQPALAEQPTQPTNTITLTEEQQKFISANGGFEKVFGKMKNAVSNPQPKEELKTEPTVNEKLTNQPQVQPEPQMAEGFISPREIAAMQYNNMLATDPKYAQISEYISKGEFLSEMKGMGMSPVDVNGNLNDRTIRQFLDLKAQTVPAKPEGDPASSSAPTVQYVEVGENITSREEAMAVLQQPNHPRHNDAKAFLQKEILGKK